MKEVVVRSDNLDFFSRVFDSTRRRNLLTSVDYDIMYKPPAEGKLCTKRETQREKTRINAKFQHHLRNLFYLLRAWQDDLDGNDYFCRPCPLTLNVINSEQYRTKIDRTIYPVLLVQVRESIPTLDRVQRFESISWPNPHPITLCKIAASLPNLTEIWYDISEPDLVLKSWQREVRKGISIMPLPLRLENLSPSQI